jgi:nickel-dependent lactate racemase
MGFVEEFIFYGDDIKLERFHPDTRFLYANPPLPPVPDPLARISQALDNPLGADTLEKQLHSTSRVTIAFDDACFPIPFMRRDVRGLIIEELLRRLYRIGIKKEQIRLICANGLHRKWTLKELTPVLGPKLINELGHRHISCHDGTDDTRLIHLGSTPDGKEVEINRAVAESDITIYVNLNWISMNGGWKSITVGLGSWRSIRHHHNPTIWNGQQSIMDPFRSPMHRVLNEMGGLIKEKYNIFTIESVVNNDFWIPPLDRLMPPINSGRHSSRPGVVHRAMLSAASLSPIRLKRFIRSALRANYQMLDVNAGDIETVHPRTMDLVFKQQNKKVSDPVDVLILGVPNLSPYSVWSIFNPILLRSMVLGYYLDAYRYRPLLKEGGVVVAYNPGLDMFHAEHHPSYVDFWEKDLEDFRDPIQCWNELAESYAQNPEYIRRYSEGYAYHGAHSLMMWFWSGLKLQRVKAVILAGAKDPACARKIGFLPVSDFSSALATAREMAGPGATMAYKFLPPLFAVDLH